MTLDFSCVKQEETSPLAIQTTCSYSSRVPYNREESSSPSILFLLSLFFSFKGKRALTGIETLYLCVMQTNQFLRPRGAGLCWLELQTYPSKCAYTHTPTPPHPCFLRTRMSPCATWATVTNRQAGRLYSVPKAFRLSRQLLCGWSFSVSPWFCLVGFLGGRCRLFSFKITPKPCPVTNT